MTDNITDSDELPPSGRGIFRQCDPDPKGSVSKAWSFSLLFIIFFFGLAVFESELPAASVGSFDCIYYDF
jgi:hypothetical protein